MEIPSFKAEIQLADAFDALFDFIAAMPATGASPDQAPIFSYLLTQRQMDEVNRVCAAKGWPLINCQGICIDINAIEHPLDARRQKDGLNDAQIKEIIRKAYSPRSLVRVNNHVSHDQQALIFNTHQKVIVGATSYHGMAVVEVRSDGARNYLAPVTCFHANEAKVRAIK